MKHLICITRIFQTLLNLIFFMLRLLIILGLGCWLGFWIGIEFCRPLIPGSIPSNSPSVKWLHKFLRPDLRRTAQESRVKSEQLTKERTLSMPVTKQNHSLHYGITYGEKTAPHHLVNFFDIGCTHCATFFKTTWPLIRQHFVETGKLQVTFTPYPIHAETLLLMTCAEKLIPAELQILFEVLMESDLSTVSALTVMEQCMETFRKKVGTPTPETLKEALHLTQKHEFTALPILFLDGKQLSDEEQDDLVHFLEEQTNEKGVTR